MGPSSSYCQRYALNFYEYFSNHTSDKICNQFVINHLNLKENLYLIEVTFMFTKKYYIHFKKPQQFTANENNHPTGYLLHKLTLKD